MDVNQNVILESYCQLDKIDIFPKILFFASVPSSFYLAALWAIVSFNSALKYQANLQLERPCMTPTPFDPGWVKGQIKGQPTWWGPC